MLHRHRGLMRPSLCPLIDEHLSPLWRLPGRCKTHLRRACSGMLREHNQRELCRYDSVTISW